MTIQPLVRVVSCSGGKDSTATMLLAMEAEGGGSNVFVFADTGNEHELTLEYVHRYLPERLGVEIRTVRADFSEHIARKRTYVQEEWPKKGVPQEIVANALSILYPTGVPFLDLCLWKSRFPSRMVQFCTQELKRYPLDAMMLEFLAEGSSVESWRGIRRQESRNRQKAQPRERTPEGWDVVHPILEWSADEVVAFVRSKGVELNPLYKLGMGRVGCMPCINCGKDELSEIARRFPDHIARIREWERMVGLAAKHGASTFFTDGFLDIPTGEIEQVEDEEGELVWRSKTRRESDGEIVARLNIDARVKWAMTTRGGRQFSLLKAVDEPEACSSIYGLCE